MTLDFNNYRICLFYRELFVSTSLQVCGKWIPTVQRLSKARAFSWIFDKTEGTPLIQSRTTSRTHLIYLTIRLNVDSKLYAYIPEGVMVALKTNT